MKERRAEDFVVDEPRVERGRGELGRRSLGEPSQGVRGGEQASPVVEKAALVVGEARGGPGVGGEGDAVGDVVGASVGAFVGGPSLQQAY